MTAFYNTIVWLKSEATGKRFPMVQFSADTDMVTNGWVSLSSIENTEVVITQATAEEYRAIAKGSDGYLLVEQRVNQHLERSDLRAVWIVEVEKPQTAQPGISFQDFKKTYRPPKLWFRDIFALNGRAAVEAEIDLPRFQDAGGKFEILEEQTK